MIKQKNYKGLFYFNNMKKIILFLGILLISLIFISGCTGSQQKNTEPETTVRGPTTVMQEPDTTTTAAQESGTTEPKTVEISMIAKQWEFDPSTITVNKGDKVVLHVKSIDVAHGISISQFGVSEYLEPGKTVDIEFIADKTGEFTFFCNVYCGEGHSSMRGKLIVE